MADLSTSFDPAAVGTSSDAASDAASRANAASDAASNALSKITANSAAWAEPALTAAPASDHTVSGITITLTAGGGTTNFGDIGYIMSNGQVGFGDADAIATASCLVMCADAQITNGSAGKWLLFGIARDDTWAWTVGGLIYLTITGTTGNTLTQTAPSATDDVIQIVGVATHADRMFFNPQLIQVEHT